MEITDILLTVIAAGLALSTTLLGFQLRALSRRIDRAEDRAELRAAEDRATADKRAAEDRARAAEDRAVNKADHARLFDAVSGVQTEVGDLKADVKVLKDRSDRAERKSAD